MTAGTPIPAATRHLRPRKKCAPRLMLALLAAGFVLPANAAERRAATGAPIELPPMLVEESISSVPWLYVNAGGTEFLSRCSASTTRGLVEGWLSKLQLVRALVPEEFLARMDVPAVFVLYAQDLQHTVSAEIQRELQSAAPRDADPSRDNDVTIASTMRLTDRDMHASIAYIDEARFNPESMRISPNHVRYLLDRRVPELPTWLTEGIERAWLRTDFIEEPITFGPLVWANRRESAALASDETRPRAVLPASDLFAAGVARASENRNPRRREIRTSTQELFVRWALLSSEQTRRALWQFVARAAEEPVTEELFEASFGFGFSELRDRLSDYVPEAVDETTWLNPGREPPLPRIEVERATPNQIARIRGEWERLAVGHVQRRMPQVRDPYLAQARRTLRRAYDTGDRDPRLLATMGLCEIDAGNEAGAREFLEPAVASGVVRPRAHYELARLRFAELRRAAPDAKTFSFTQVAPVIQPLQQSLTQSPPLPEAFALLAEAWAACEMPPNTAEFAELELGARLFGRRPPVAYYIALALARHGKKPQASAVLDGCAGYVADDVTRTAIAELRAELAAVSARTAEDPRRIANEDAQDARQHARRGADADTR